MVRRIKLGIFQRMQIVYQLYLDKIQQTPVNCVSNFVKTRKIPFVFFFVNLTAGADGRATGSGAATVVVWHIIRLFSGRESRGAPQTTRQALARHVKTKRNEEDSRNRKNNVRATHAYLFDASDREEDSPNEINADKKKAVGALFTFSKRMNSIFQNEGSILDVVNPKKY